MSTQDIHTLPNYKQPYFNFILNTVGRKLIHTYAGLLSGPCIVITPYRNTNIPINEGASNHAVY
jgi:hypothetical protein